MDTIEFKKVLEDQNKTLEAMRSEKGADAEKMAKMQADFARIIEEKSSIETRLAEVENKAARPNGLAKADAPDEHKAAFMDYIRDAQNSSARARLDAEQKAAQVTVSGTDGVAIPRVLASSIITVLTNVSPIRSLATVVNVSTTDYVEQIDMANAETEWVGEMDVRKDTAAPDLGRIVPAFGEQHAIITVSTHALRDANFNLEAWLTASISRKFSEGEGKAFISGNGVNKPKGLLSAGNGFSTVKTGAAGGLGANPHDRLMALYYGLSGAYRTNAAWLMNSGQMAQLATQKDANGGYLYQPSLTAAGFDTIHGKRVVIAEDMPDMAANATPIGFGDLARAYLIADIMGMSLIVDPYTRPGFVRFIVAKRVGGTPRDTAAMKFLKVEA